MTRITMAVPLAHIAAANELAACVGYGAADRFTFSLSPVFRDGEGQHYAVASSVVAAEFLTEALSPLREPAWGADLALAAAAQTLVMLSDLDEAADMPAHPHRIAAVIGEDAAAALIRLGLSLVA